MALTAVRAEEMICGADQGWVEVRGVQLARWMMGLVEAGVGAAGAAVLPLAALHHARNLQARHYRETPVPHLQGAAHDSQFI